MSNVLDLKDFEPGTVPSQSSIAEDVSVAPVIAQENQDEPTPEATLAGLDFPTTVEWTAHHPLEGPARNRHAFVSAGIVLMGALVSIWQRSPVAFIVLLIGAGVLELREHMKKPTTVAVDQRGIKIDDQSYEHASFTSFHIHRMPDETLELSLRSEKRFLPHFRLPLGQQDPHKLHAVLAQYIPEGEHKIPLIDYFIRKPR